MASGLGATEKRSRPESSGLHEGCELGTNNGQPSLEPMTPPSSPPNDGIQAPSASDSLIACAEEQQEVETSGPGDQLQHTPSSSGCVAGNEEHIITAIRATDVAIGLRRIPAGFYALVHHSGRGWKTENKRSLVDVDVVEWTGSIPMQDLHFFDEIYASFEFEPMLGAGELLQKLTITVERLLGYSPTFTFFPIDGDVVSPCSSISVTIQRWKREGSDSSTLRVLDPHYSTRESGSELEDATNRGHSALSRYRNHGEIWDLECSVEEFERALDVCPPEHPCRAAAESNLAMAKFILCRGEDMDTSFEVPLNLYRNALIARPVGHVDRPSTLIQQAAVHIARFEMRWDEAERDLGEALLREAMELSSTDSHENRAAKFMLQLHARHDGDTVEDSRTLSVQFLHRFEQFGDLADLQQAIAILEESVESTPVSDDGYFGTLSNLAIALFYRFNHLGELSDLEDAILRQRAAIDLTPRGHPEKPHYLDNLCTSLRTRFERLGQLSDLNDAISTLKDAVDLTPHDHPDKPARLTELGNSFLSRFERFGQLSDIDNAVSMFRDALNLVPDDHAHKPASLSNLGTSLRTRFERLGHPSDLENAISVLRNAANLAPHGHPHKPGCLNNLGTSFLIRFESLGQPRDLEDAILTFKNAVNITPHGHPHIPACLHNLGKSFRIRFQRLGQLNDVEDAISTLREAVSLTPPGHPDKAVRLFNLAITFRVRFERLGQLPDLEHAISTFKDAVDLTPQGHPNKPACLTNLGNTLHTRFKRLRQLRDLEDSISRHQDAIGLTPHSHPQRPTRLHNLGISLVTRFEHLGQLSDLQEAVSKLKDVVNLDPHSHPEKHDYLNLLSTCFVLRFQRLGELSDIEDSIPILKEAIRLTPHGHPDKPARLNNLGISFKNRFQRLGQPSDLDGAISTLREAVDLTRPGHPHKPDYLGVLSACFTLRFQRLGELGDLEDTISTLRDAVDLLPHDHPDKPTYLNALSTSFRARFKRLGNLSDVDDMISTLRDAIDLTPHGHTARLDYLNNLGTSFATRFQHLGQLKDLEDAISTLKVAVDLVPHGHPHKPGYLTSLGNFITTHFERLGHLGDLEQAISMLRDAVDLAPHGHPDRPASLSSFGNSLIIRFERLGQLGDLEDAISAFRDAVHLTPQAHLDKPGYLDNLGISFATRFHHLGELSDLHDAISILRDAVDLTPPGHSPNPGYFNNLGISLRARFERLGELRDLEDAISTLSEAVNHTPHGHTHKPARLDNLGNVLRMRFERLGQLSDLEDAISILRDAVALTLHGHPAKPGHLNSLGISFRTRFVHFGELNNLEQAISIFSHAASSPIGPINVRFDASQNWISCARHMSHPSLLHAYSVAIRLLPQLAWIGHSLEYRYSELTRGADVVHEAAAAALDSGFPETALEWLEQARSIVWGELSQLRSSYEELSSVHPDHARRLQEISAALDHASVDREKSLSAPSGQNQGVAHRATESPQQVADRHRALAIERDKLLQEIRRFPGFERFLLHKAFSQLRASAHSGPVVMLNAARSRCDALIVLADVDHVIHVPLPNFNSKRSADLQNLLRRLLSHVRTVRSDEREGKTVKLNAQGVSWELFLSPLWKCVVKPVLDALGFSQTPDALSRIFWCPTGPLVFLPIHAAGFYDPQYSQPGHKVYDFVISSYVPNISILGPPNPATAPSSNLRLLAVRQPPSDGQSPLPGVETELAYMKEVVRNSPSAQTTLAESSCGTVEEVLSLMKESDWVHFACHGAQDGVDSGLCLADRRRLKLRDIIGLSRPRGGLAFLSACQTAMGEEGLSDEAVHIAAGMLFAGYGGVIGTMWSISDKLAPRVARDVYRELFRNGTRPDYRDAARALHETTIEHLRDRNASFGEWLPFIHMGL